MNARILALLWTACCLTGCSLWKPQKEMTKLSIPDMGNAEEQLTYATRFQANSFPGGTGERRADQRNQFRQVYGRVVTKWPDDRQSTPLAKFMLATFDREDGNLRKALEEFRSIQTTYPEFTALKVRAMFAEANVHDQQKLYDDAKLIYHRIMTDYASNTDPRIQRVVKQATTLYYATRKIKPGDRPKT
jgi:hypothetical protein